MSVTLGEVGRLIVTFGADRTEFSRDLRNTDQEARSTLGGLQDYASRGFSGLKKAVGAGILGGLGLVTAGFGALAVAFSDSEAQARESINAEKQLNAVLKSTGGAAGMSAQELKDLAGSLQKVTNFGDDATIQGESLLLTFTRIGKDVFPRATETMLDMSQSLGQDMKSSAIQLGKALNDPIAGVSALSRVGVSFTEQQKEQIKVLQESGDMMGAQTIILDELAKEFGGSARAMADPTIQMANAFGDLKEVVGGVIVRFKNEFAEKALPLIGTAITKTTELIKGLTEGGWGLSETLTFLAANLGLGALKGKALADTITGAIDRVTGFKDAALKFLAPILDVIGGFVEWKDVLIALGLVAASIVIPILAGIVAAALPVIAVAAALVGAVALVRQAWENDWGGMRTIIESAFGIISENFRGLMDGSLTLSEALGNAFSGIVALIQGKLPDWVETLQGWATAIWQWIVDAAPVAISRLGDFVGGLIGGLAAGLPDFLAGIYEWATAIVVWIGDAIPKAIDSLTEFIESLGSEGDGTGRNTFLPMVGRWVGLLIGWVATELIPQVGPAFLEFGLSLATALGKIALALLELGATLGGAILDGLVAGINAGTQMVADAVLNAAKAAWEAAKKFLGISSPSRLFSEIGDQMMAGFAVGVGGNDDMNATLTTALSKMLTAWKIGLLAMKSMWDAAWAELSTAWETLEDWLDSRLPEALGKLLEAWETDWTAIIRAVTGAWIVLLVAFVSMKNWLDNILPVALTTFHVWLGAYVLPNPFAAFVEAVGAVGPALDGAKKLIDNFASWTGGVRLANPFTAWEQILDRLEAKIRALQTAINALPAGSRTGARAGAVGSFPGVNAMGAAVGRMALAPAAVGGGGGITVNVYATVRDGMDVEALAWRVAQTIQRRQR